MIRPYTLIKKMQAPKDTTRVRPICRASEAIVAFSFPEALSRLDRNLALFV